MTWHFPWPQDQIARYQAQRIASPPDIDGNLEKAVWREAVRSPACRDMVNGEETVHDTRAAVLWDEQCLYVGFWVQEPFVEAALTERDSLIFTENDIELFIAGPDTYYELEVNALGTVYEALFVWDEAYERGGYHRRLGLAPGSAGHQPFNGVGFTTHPRGGRQGFFRWDMPGLQVATAVDGTLNDPSDRDRGWTVEIAIPWASLGALTPSGEPVVPAPGQVWGMDFSRFNTYKSAPPAVDHGGWVWSPHGVWDSHVPELYTQVTLVEEKS